jgi:lipopolysaccharide export system permease protein
MKLLDRHIIGAFLVTFFMSVLVLTFVVLLGAICKIMYVIGQGVAWQPIVKMFLLNIPQVLSFSIPLSILVSTLLVFGRLSGDGEIVAMRSSGVPLFRIARWPIILALVLTGACLFISQWALPWGHLKARTLLAELKRTPPIELFEVGRFNEDIPGLSIYIGRRVDKNLYDIRVFDSRTEIVREIHAKEGTIVSDDDGDGITLNLLDVRFEPALDGQPGSGYCSRLPVHIDSGKARRVYHPKEADMMGPDLIQKFRNPELYYPDMNEEDLRIKVSKLKVEFHGRTALSFACLAFMFLGIPLGIKAHRKETSIGAGMGMVLMFFFYLFIITAESLAEQPQWAPHLIAWMPVIGNSALGIYLLRRAS